MLDIIPAVARPMWLTEEYATNDFTSVCRIHTHPARVPPIRDTLITKEALILFRRINLDANRRRPYLPNFSRIPARIMEPATGASTWAFGSQRCVIYRGVLTRNAKIVIIHQRGRTDV